MPEKRSDTSEQKQPHIVGSEGDRGRIRQRTEEVPSDAVNETRRQGRAASPSTSRAKNRAVRLERRTREQLLQRAAELEIRGRSKMTKRRLIEAIRRIN